MRLPRLALALGIACTSACTKRTASPADTALARIRSDPRALMERVAALRGLPDARPTRIVFDAPDAFKRALVTKAERDGIGGTVTETVGFHLVFEQPPVSARAGSSSDEVIDEQVIAFYDRHTHTVHVRDELSHDQTADDLAGVIAHELMHSLQEQHFSIPDFAEITDRDTRLAYNSVLEGEAMLVMLAYLSEVNRILVTRALVRASERVAEQTFGEFARASGRAGALARAPALVRERLIFPYLQGLVFMGVVHRAGGFDLVSRVHAHPPKTTEQVLHPEKYLAGEAAVPVLYPVAPDGYEALLRGRVGELQLKVVLSSCMPKTAAAAAAAGWGGDAFTIASRGEQPALLWATAWDGEREAVEFERAANAWVACTRRRAGARIVPAGDVVLRSGTRVAIARGLPEERGAAVAATLHALVGAAPARVPPLGAVTVPPVRTASAFHPPYVNQGVYVNEQLGLVISVPAGFEVEMPAPTAAVFARHQPSTAIGGVFASDQLASRATVDELHAELAETVRQSVGARNLEYQVGRDVTLHPLGRGIERVWSVPGTSAELSAVVLPVCAGAGSYVVWRFWTDDESARALYDWMRSVRLTRDEAPPICALLNP